MASDYRTVEVANSTKSCGLTYVDKETAVAFCIQIGLRCLCLVSDGLVSYGVVSDGLVSNGLVSDGLVLDIPNYHLVPEYSEC